MDQHINASIAQYLLDYRKKNNLTQVQLAKLIGSDSSRISLIERGRSYVDLKLFLKIINNLNIEINEIIEYNNK